MKTIELIPMEYFVLTPYSVGYDIRIMELLDYARLLKTPLSLGQFVACDEEGNPLIEPRDYYVNIDGDEICMGKNIDEVAQFKAAKERIIFPDFEVVKPYDAYAQVVNRDRCVFVSFADKKYPRVMKNESWEYVKTISDLTGYGLKVIMR